MIFVSDFMIFAYVTLAWLILMIARNVYKGKKEKKQMTIGKGGMRKYFNGRFKW